MTRLQEIWSANTFLVLDGAMGTMLMDAGLTQGAAPEEWNVTQPDKVRQIHEAYIAAGSDIILTNSFGGTSFRLKLHNLQDRVYEFNRAAAVVARQAAVAVDRPVLVAGSIGPSGELLQPMGEMSYEAAVAAFAEQARGLNDGGADCLWVETMSDINEVRAAVKGARSVSELPIVATMSFDTNGRTMMGHSPTEVADALAELELLAFGANCGNNLPDTEAAIVAMHEARPEARLVAKANAGIPRWGEDGLEYDGTPEVMANFARRVHAAGATLIGGCCGSAPAHINQMRQALDNPIPANELLPLAGLASSPRNGAVPESRRPARARRRRRV